MRRSDPESRRILSSSPPSHIERIQSVRDAPRTAAQRIEEAGPLLFVAGACFALGVGLRATGGTGPVEAFPVWSLFLALGLVASLGAGFLLLSDDEPLAREKPRIRPRDVEREVPEGAEMPWPAPVLSGGGPAATSEDIGRSLNDEEGWGTIQMTTKSSPKSSPKPSGRATKATPPIAEPPDPGGRDAPDEMIDEIDRMLSDLQPARRRAAPP